jgi:BlaI family transcriptional regulator, penicillinase repressor
MPERPAVSKGKMEVARILWGLKNAIVREVHAALPRSRSGRFSAWHADDPAKPT